MALKEYRFAFLLFSLVLLMVVSPVVYALPLGGLVLSGMFIWLLLTVAFSVSERHWLLNIARMLTVPAIGLSVLSAWSSVPESPFSDSTRLIAFLDRAIAIAFLFYISCLVLKSLFASRYVTVETINAAICLYLLLGVLWVLAYSSVEYVGPDAFVGGDFTNPQQSFASFYFSFVTLTTLGYGDISPTIFAPPSTELSVSVPMVSRAACTLATPETITGQIYITVLVARPVGLHIFQNRNDEPHSE